MMQKRGKNLLPEPMKDLDEMAEFETRLLQDENFRKRMVGISTFLFV